MLYAYMKLSKSKLINWLKLGVVARACNHSIQEVEAWRSSLATQQIQDQSVLPETLFHKANINTNINNIILLILVKSTQLPCKVGTVNQFIY